MASTEREQPDARWASWDGNDPVELIRAAAEEHPRVAISFSGAEDVVLVHMASQAGCKVDVFCLDTGRLHAETYRFLERVRVHYGIDLEVMFPSSESVEKLVRAKGLESFFVDGHTECCRVRKVEPLRRKLATVDAWITGQRRDQSPTRTDVAFAERDMVFGSAERPLWKYNPLAAWSSARVWGYIRANGIPYNELHTRGYVSIGCEPCTRTVVPGQHEREGRWWWEEQTARECGLHVAKPGG